MCFLYQDKMGDLHFIREANSSRAWEQAREEFGSGGRMFQELQPPQLELPPGDRPSLCEEGEESVCGGFFA